MSQLSTRRFPNSKGLKIVGFGQYIPINIVSLIPVFHSKIDLQTTTKKNTLRDPGRRLTRQFCASALLLVSIIFLVSLSTSISVEAGTCMASSQMSAKKPPPGQCNQENDSGCCKQGRLYSIYNM